VFPRWTLFLFYCNAYSPTLDIMNLKQHAESPKLGVTITSIDPGINGDYE
jgi:hypothetical protein